MKLSPPSIISNINYYNKLIENKKVELDGLIAIRDKLIESYDQEKLALNK